MYILAIFKQRNRNLMLSSKISFFDLRIIVDSLLLLYRAKRIVNKLDRIGK